ncbi:MAG: prepilin-type N-terminal cleavage/methylation domain-containing protein [Proteobacteria bacterium]|nr:prepilin-type N-terminal cleavage/methylation domain-containing protein [Pseudomonadota bacterium]
MCSATPPRAAAVRGFTMIELLVVVVIFAIGAAVTSLALRDPAATHLDEEAVRLAAILEAARADARAAGLQVLWMPAPAGGDGFQFVGLPPATTPPTNWLSEGVHAEVVGARSVVLGPEPMIGPQRIVLRLDDRQVVIATDGLGPFAIVDDAGTH